MAFDLIPRRSLFPNLSLSDIWEDDDTWISNVSSGSGLSVSEDDTKIYVEAALPGIDPKHIDVTFQDGYLWIRGEIKETESDTKKKYYRKAAHSFSYRVAVPGEIDNSKEPEASYKHGVMTIVFSKSPKVQPKKISLKNISE